MRQIKVVVEKHSDGYVAYPLGLKGIVVGEGDSYEEVLADVKSAIQFHVDTFGADVFESDSPVLETCDHRQSDLLGTPANAALARVRRPGTPFHDAATSECPERHLPGKSADPLE